ncbi:helix-turn-helix domain-containing protein [Metabacillus fastidiosus]|uniref:helix-turn-helix domain-containing protein n=1 Tax=Metabacillus fastidiosus TaxID=1458 RepID=UPI003D2AA476
MLADKLINERKRKNYTQQRVADYLGITRPAYTAYERGTRHPDYETLKKLSTLYDVSTDYLLGQSDNSDPASKITVSDKEINLSKEELEILKEIKKYPTLFHDLANAPEKKVKQLIKMWEIIKADYEDDDVDDDVIDDL